MESDTLLDSLVFQLTPTRTRCDLVIAANGNMEKIASGLLEPFLAHLKTARDQIAKGGYSITLKPDPRSDMTWFTKGTVERFVRFVSTPEVLERVDTIESEMLQIDEAIAIQNNDNLGLSTVEDHQSKYSENIEGSKPVSDAGSEKAIVLFKPGVQAPESNGSTILEENSKVQLLRVLETRKTVLQKEQGMAFARAVAAGFDMEHLAYLLSFAEFFGASRLMEACIRFMELWKRKHETGQWLEIEAAEAMSSQSDFSAMNTSGIVFSGDMRKHNEFREAWPESHGELGIDSNGKARNDATNSDHNNEEDIKRLEALKRERQKRIAARGNSSSAQSPSSLQQSKSRLPTKLSPGSHKGSKFSDSEPGSSSLVQQFPKKLASTGSNDSQKATKPGRLNGTSIAGNGLSRSVSSLPELKKEVIGPEPKAIPVKNRRLSDPKGSNGHHATLKSGGSDPLSKPKLPVEPEIKKISAIMSLDRTKSATLPELKIKTSRSNSNISQTKSAAKEIKQKGNGNRSSLTSESMKQKKSNDKTPHLINEDGNPVIEKTVEMLEHDICAVPVVQTSEENPAGQKGACDEGIGQAAGVAEYAALHAPASPNIISEVEKDPSEFQFDVHPSLKEMTTGHASDELPMSPSISVKEKPYQAPFARASSLEDPCTSNLEYGNAPPVTSEMETITETGKVHISDSTDLNSAEVIPGSLEKPRGKESKGFRRLLKFGRKSHSSAAGEHNVDSDKFGVDGPAIEDNTGTDGSPEVHMLKNLISQDDSPVGGSTSQKVSRHFSLLSPFRSKNSEKKLTT
ncbi:titin [Cinnamomum micranthum f. kanehirae]|uniref:Titin n=1 Tax=Cinnamomum micranthum f. kanehirae TaxID=337451 RepID=A0A443NZM4_9MAGN|nr:titin [Cinnamomum micranthum f. kanehirae]